MRAVVLVGGFGTRLRPLTTTTPKQMLPVGHRPMIERVIGHLARHGVDEVVLSLGYKPDVFTAFFPDGTCAGARLIYAVEPEPLDTAGAIRFAADAAAIDETFVVVNGDVLTDLDVAGLVRFHREHGAEGTIHLTPVDDPSAFGVVPTDHFGRVVAFIEKPKREDAPTNNINAGTYVLEPSVLARIPFGRKASIERETFPRMARDGVLYALATQDYWIDTGNPANYLQANLDLYDGHRSTPAGGAAVHPAAMVDADAKVTHSVIEGGAVVAAGAEVVDSLLLAGARVEHGASVRASVLGPGTVVGAGARLEGVTTGDHVVIDAREQLIGVRVPDPG
jgi:mannose-1-phosphate guanylyltransferase